MEVSAPESTAPTEAPARPRERLVGPDVTRGVALIGVVIMNYHGYLNGCSAVAGPTSSLAQSMFDPWTGVLSTRFAATFVLRLHRIGSTLMPRNMSFEATARPHW